MRMTAEDDAQGGVFMIFWDQPQGWSIKKTPFHGTNVMRCEVVNGKQNQIIGAYPPPPPLSPSSYIMEDLPDLSEDLTHF